MASSRPVPLVGIIMVVSLLAGACGGGGTAAPSVRAKLIATSFTPGTSGTRVRTRTVLVTCGRNGSVVNAARPVRRAVLCRAVQEYVAHPIPRCSFGAPSAGPANGVQRHLLIEGVVKGRHVRVPVGLGTWCNLTVGQTLVVQPIFDAGFR